MGPLSLPRVLRVTLAYNPVSAQRTLYDARDGPELATCKHLSPCPVTFDCFKPEPALGPDCWLQNSLVPLDPGTVNYICVWQLPTLICDRASDLKVVLYAHANQLGLSYAQQSARVSHGACPTGHNFRPCAQRPLQSQHLVCSASVDTWAKPFPRAHSDFPPPFLRTGGK